ncbi:hypothetical protein BFT35_03965 [Thermoanaerobacterium thermosaccharolyticum]|uniref:hypothetical protein n=1 Tax=Thermoanaerobacterium thermosaccharolyticum TaxID=1517 RepID=UPI000C07A8D4|nr:hypothetical protein [Thermoanaerobacterium thermosaccharolyticum]PHO07899.1 hypothetical protein BFT35_03965 [Thermoanaerobacterium thermosaccharolyticum]
MKNKCRDCEFCFQHDEFGYVCAGDNYGENISDSLDVEKPCYSEGLGAFINRAKQEEIIYIANTKLAQLKIDGRKMIELIDKDGKTIIIKASKAKKIFGDVEVLKRLFDDEYIVDAVFNSEMFKNGKVIKISF